MKTVNKFSGFTPAAFQFFAELEENNYKPWFDEHKPVYELEVLQPLKALANALVPFFANMDAQMDFRPVKMVSRIYRDIRFSHDKSPYKTHMWAGFQRPFQKQTDDWMSFPGFYIEISKDGANYGMGLFEAKKKIMDRYRDQIAYEPDNFRKITAGLVEKHGFKVEGEEYKRPIANELDEDLQTWIQRKSIFVTKRLQTKELLYSEKFVPHMEKEFALLQPLYDFLTDICD